MPVRHGLPRVKELADKDLLCTRTGQVALDYRDAKSLMEVIREFYDEHRAGPGHPLAKEYYGDKYGGVKEWQVSEYSGAKAAQGQITWEDVGSSKAAGVSIDRYLPRHSKLLEMPLLHIHKFSAGKRGVLLWFREGGKATVANWPEIKKYVDEATMLSRLISAASARLACHTQRSLRMIRPWVPWILIMLMSIPFQACWPIMYTTLC